jgi:hypothetical protein
VAHEFVKGSGWGWDKFILSSIPSTWIAQDTLKVHCHVWIYTQVKDFDRAIEAKRRRFEKECRQLKTDLDSALKSSFYADLILKCGAKTFKVHKTVLACKYFYFYLNHFNNSFIFKVEAHFLQK